MWKRLGLAVLESIIIGISAVLGAFAWSHLSPIFNSMDWLNAFSADISAHGPAYIAIVVLFVILFIVLLIRSGIVSNSE
jgi:preprotein translocase subunit SecY